MPKQYALRCTTTVSLNSEKQNNKLKQKKKKNGTGQLARVASELFFFRI